MERSIDAVQGLLRNPGPGAQRGRGRDQDGVSPPGPQVPSRRQ
ncbi:hypothetical protein [Lysobacter gummosus]